jgi:hypothetical protein
VEVSQPSKFSVRQIAADRRHVRTEDDVVPRRRWAAAQTTVVFFGFAERGPFSEPVAVAEWPTFVDTFGDLVEGMYLAYAVYGFLSNGGTSCYVVRLDSELAGDREHLLRWFDNHDDVSVVSAPDAAAAHAAGRLTDEAFSDFSHWLVALCEFDNVLALIDPPPDLTPQTVHDWRLETLPIDSRAAAMYYPWLTIDDPLLGRRRNVPPSGHVAGVLARNDLMRGFHTAPGNLTVHNAEDVAVPLSRNEMHFLTPIGINLLTLSPGRGVVVWGARTFSSDPDWMHLRRHRLVAFLVRQIRAQVRAGVGEEDLPAAVSELCHLLWRSGALWGESADDAYAVSLGEGDHSTVAVDCVVAVERDFSVPLRIVYRGE